MQFILKAYTCKMKSSKNGQTRTLVTELRLMDETTTKYVKTKNPCHFSHNLNNNVNDLAEMAKHVVEIEVDHMRDY
ncbi:hypothetical protein niasHT_027182 [Heterodera trifolii]|uniref:Uncharacterized protein n=1 Tax=Heterodera trifolii TaxID=157864 RepID=A0ABD2KP43_9BILA